MKNKNIQTEIDASYLYHFLSIQEEDPHMSEIFKQMSAIEKSHARAFMDKYGMTKDPFPEPSIRAKIIIRLAKWLGNDFVLGILLNTEKSISNSIKNARKLSHAETPAITDTSHVAILRNIIDKQQNISGQNLARFEKKHRSIGGNALRAAVLGGNDGLVSNFSLVMGIAGATQGNQEILLAGMAGLLAGALSMALGEWISVKSSQELYENQMALEMDELEINPEAEEKEIALIYMSKGIERNTAEKMASEIMTNKNKTHEFLVKEELGINSEELKGSAMEAAITSFILFAIGAIIPVIPFFFSKGYLPVIISIALSAIGLFLIGALITIFTNKGIWYSGIRQVLFGLSAAGITYGIGHLIGVQIGG